MSLIWQGQVIHARVLGLSVQALIINQCTELVLLIGKIMLVYSVQDELFNGCIIHGKPGMALSIIRFFVWWARKQYKTLLVYTHFIL